MVGTGTVLKNRWKLSKKIGQGAFGEIYNGTDTTTQDPVAVKLERWDNKKAVLKMEVAVLKKLQHCQYACRYVSASYLLPPRRASCVFSLRWVRHVATASSHARVCRCTAATSKTTTTS
jgi:serine/threonine protein kinase